MKTTEELLQQEHKVSLYRLYREAKALREQLFDLPYNESVSRIYHRALRRENRRRRAFYKSTEIPADG